MRQKNRRGIQWSFEQSNSSWRPLHVLAEQNGKDVIRFDASNKEHLVETKDDCGKSPGDISVVIGFKPANITSGCILAKAGATNKDYMYRIQSGLFVFQGGSGWNDITYSPPPINQPCVLIGTWNEATNTIYNYVNGVKTTGTTIGAIIRSSTIQDVFVGARYNNGGVIEEPFDGDFYMHKILRKCITDKEAAVETQSAAREWGIAI